MNVVLNKKGDPEQTAEALVGTFRLFGTELPESAADIGALSDRFVERNAAAWSKECRQRGFHVPVPDLAGVVEALREGIEPLLARANEIERGPRP